MAESHLRRMTNPSPPTFIGRYRVFGELAAGGQASVRLGCFAGPAGFVRAVAIKRVRSDHADSAKARAMLIDEARLASRVQHPNVVQLLDVVDDGPELVLVMELVQGESLARLCRQSAGGAAPPLAVAIAVIAGALRGLHAAHEAVDAEGQPLHLVHRDLSPQNILVDVHGVPKVLDFGIAWARGRQQDETRDGTFKGKLAYLSPEQVHGTSDRRSDIWAAGVVLWECLTGKRLFVGENDGALLSSVLSAVVRRPSEFNHEVPNALDAIVLQALAREPNARFGTAAAMAEALEHLGGASQQQLAGWVQSRAGAAIERTRQRVREIESASGLEVPGAPVDPPALDAPAKLPQLEDAPRRSWPLAFAAVVLWLSATAGAWRWASAPPAVEPGPAAVAPSPEPTPVPAPSPAEPTPPETVVPATAVPPTAPRATALVGQSDAGARAPKPTPRPRPAGRRGCEVPFVMVNGVKQWKPECF